MAITSLAVLMTSHNRRDKTLAAVEAVMSQSLNVDVDITIYLVDAGSTDGTAREVRHLYPDVKVIEKGPDLFWNRGMYLAFNAARKDDYDFYFWLNDDTMMAESAFSRFLDAEKTLRNKGHLPGILVGTTLDPVSGLLSYGGLNCWSRLNPLRLAHSDLSSAPKRVHTMNGNCVLITREAFRSIGNLDWSFIHGMGDIDYGLRAKKLGIEIWTAPDSVGHCARNAIHGSWQDESLAFEQRWRNLLGPKGLPPSSWFVLTRRHGGPIWPLIWAWPYCRMVLDSALKWSRKVGGKETDANS